MRGFPVGAESRCCDVAVESDNKLTSNAHSSDHSTQYNIGWFHLSEREGGGHADSRQIIPAIPSAGATNSRIMLLA